ncbi:MAG: hypothetical protein DHS20C15_10640 [Planctomycetota bacterium]|nr:MAG: hypothetical protein DHS20C15_10640 [Planctomycetota bacterium]
MPSPRSQHRTLALVVAALACLATSASTQIEVAALSGDATPEGTHIYKSFGLPVVGQDGALVFSFDTPDFGPFHFSGVLEWDAGALLTRTDENTPVPSGAPGEVFELVPSNGPARNAQGTLALKSRVLINQTLLLRQSGGGALELLGRDGDTAPDGNGTLEYGDGFAPTINAGGSVAVSVNLFNTSGGTTDDQAILRFDAAGSPPVRIVREGDPAPGGGTLSGLSAGAFFPNPSMNNSGEVAFTSETAFGEFGVFVGDGNSTTAIARSLEVAPGTGGTQTLSAFSSLNPINDSGVVAFAATFVSGGGFGAIYRGDGVSMIPVTMTGDPAPTAGGGVDGTYLLLSPSLGLNAAGQVAFSAATDSSALHLPGLFLATPGQSDLCILRLGQAASGGDSFLRVEEFALNDAGQLAFRALVASPGALNFRALYLWSPGSGISEVIREGDSLAGSTVTGLDLSGVINSPSGARDRAGLNDAGEVAFRFALADNRSGVATTAPGAAPTWVDEGCALAGTLGEPVLAGAGSLAAGSNNSITLSNAAPFASAGLFFGLSSVPFPFKGGMLKPVPWIKLLFTNTSGAGGVALPFVMPTGVPTGTSLWTQWVIQDAGGVSGFALSNAVRGDTP